MASLLPFEFQSYKPNIDFYISADDFYIKIANTEKELLDVFKLRNEVFYKEWTGVDSESGLDIDQYDLLADHLIVSCKNTKAVVGTYRLISTEFANNFYTSSFFEIKPFLQSNSEKKIEMGRACVKRELRDRKVIHCIWLGLARYFKMTLSRYMFGCVSIVHTNPEYIACVYKTLSASKGLLDKTKMIYPLRKFTVPQFADLLSKADLDRKALLKLPRLFLWYLNLGVRLHGPPAYDPVFKSYDFFISLDFKNIENPKLVNRYEDAVYLKKHL